ncbi:class I SAM-dependent methyltransferase [Desulfosporosinus sp. PR]|uniref:tRNA (adenine(22)-N(1))-methyltransferase n=1 Tax=Candidatus Desulfosporosinus nitrosoreducens TaxID=3401928 RepID=UPI0027EB2911|nr:class I SAM-dependent methyltransferase [Desulfosporosinus sp. PR]MDQ7096278.1 class I SAM-dependent methyltransferase [Desulfosporosinus sp. PR]
MTHSITLGPRLQMVASLVPAGARLGDIGTDHAYLPIALCEAGKLSKAVAIDVHAGPFQSAVAAVSGRQLEQIVDVRLGDGLMPLKAGEVNVLTFAGMGGKTMLEILAARPDVLESVTDLIVQPQGGESALRLTLLQAGWCLKTEQLVKEEGLIYTVMAFARNNGWNMTDLTLKERLWQQRLRPQAIESGFSAGFPQIIEQLVWHFGPLVLEERTDLLREYLGDYKMMLKRRLEQMKRSGKTEVMEKIKNVSEELVLVEGMRTWQ